MYQIPRMLLSDAYTVGSGVHVSPEAKESSGYHIAARRGFSHLHSFVEDNRMIFYGFQDIIYNLLKDPITHEEIAETKEFLKTFHAGNTNFLWDMQIWDRVVQENNGIVPIVIEALEEGDIFFPYEPIVQITAKDGFGELASYFESSLLKVWSTIERVTVLRWWYQYLLGRCIDTHKSWTIDQCEQAVNIMCHDFGDRASSCAEESVILGLAHLMVFPGTDTTSAAYAGWLLNNKQQIGSSIHALAHRTIMGFAKEFQGHAALFNIGKVTGITAHVSDTYDYKTTVKTLAEKLVNDSEWKDLNNIIVVRPDSGDPVESVLYACEIAKHYGLTTIQDGYHTSTRMRWIQGDSMDFNTMIKIIDVCLKNGYSPFGMGAFGVGGYLRNSIARDHSGLSMKLAYVGNNQRPVVKKSDTPAKSSIPGRVFLPTNTYPGEPTVHSYNNPLYSGNRLVKWYDGTKGQFPFLSPAIQPLSEIRNKIKNGADFITKQQPEQVLGSELLDLRRKIIEEQINNAFN